MNHAPNMRYRSEQTYYLPSMIAFTRRRSGWKKNVENVLTWVFTLLYVTFVIIATIYSQRHWNLIPPYILLPALGVAIVMFDLIHKIMFKNTSGLHNVPGYDPVTHTVPYLEARGIDSQLCFCSFRTGERLHRSEYPPV